MNAVRMSRQTLAVTAAALAALAVAAASFYRSFTSLSELAVAYSFPAAQAWTLPISLDGLVIVATAAAAVSRRARWYAWALLVAGTVASVVANGIHAWELTASPVGVWIAVLPPLVTLAAVHLAIMLARQQHDDAADVDNKRPEIITTSPDEPAEPEPQPRPVTRLRVAPVVDDELRTNAIQLVTEGHSLRAAGQKLGVSKDRVHRWVREHRAAQAAAAG
ncbi:helix-turn-helix domain-containing protein [Rhodococcus sp. (in: high G+C Gram-positive bacteria)]|uniref:helix-turn-helix domain-containing protein n=1 Tax=Rhodococcus sp. TaxID=1831 RepID=UPI00258B1731|nr:helix-turn-helix domain-containing protein [Rhodococcus sp. (in: high G+C Gram-positive bacteria)]